MNIIQKFETVSAIKSIAKRTFVELDNSYPIMRADLSIEAVILTLNMNDGGVVICILSPSYSRVFTEDDISNVKKANSN
jgi:hypothetical protein